MKHTLESCYALLKKAVASASPEQLRSILEDVRFDGRIIGDWFFLLLAEQLRQLSSPRLPELIRITLDFVQPGKEKVDWMRTSGHDKVLLAYRPDLFSRFAAPGAHLKLDWEGWHDLLLHALGQQGDQAVSVTCNLLMFICPLHRLTDAEAAVETIAHKSQWFEEKLDLDRLLVAARRYFERLETDMVFAALAGSLAEYNQELLCEEDVSFEAK